MGRAWDPGWSFAELLGERGAGRSRIVCCSVALSTPSAARVRGYLLPRITRFRTWAPPINALLFATYHLWKSWYLLTPALIFTPIVYAVWRLRDVRTSIGAHVALNGFGWATKIAPTLPLS